VTTLTPASESTAANRLPEIGKFSIAKSNERGLNIKQHRLAYETKKLWFLHVFSRQTIALQSSLETAEHPFSPHPGPLPWGEGDTHSCFRSNEALRIGRRLENDSPSPVGRGPG
jgi:hypothetical protein